MTVNIISVSGDSQ